MNYKWALIWVSIAVALIAILSFVVPVSAEGSYVIVENEGIGKYPYYEPYRLPYQGATVYMNETVDISGQGWGEGIAWYGKYGEYDNPQYIRQFTPYPKDQRMFYLDPLIFTGRTGYWYQYYGNTSERHGNLLSFKLVDAIRPPENETDVNETVAIPIPPEFILSERPVADYLVAKGDSLTINASRIWVFGRVDGLYGVSGELSNKTIEHLESGSYKLSIQNFGNNTVADVGYNPDTQKLWRTTYDSVYGPSTHLVDVSSFNPLLILDKYKEMVSQTDDSIELYTLEIGEPSITIESIDDVAVGNRIPVAYEPGMTLLDVRGYTNAANGTVLTFIMDEDKQTIRTLRANIYTTNATGDIPGNMRYYRIFIPINKNNMPNGMHTITASTAIGGKMYYDFPISELPADSFVPNATIKYMGDRNPWIPTPTPEVIHEIEKVTVIETQIIVQEVTQPVQLVFEQQKKASDEATWYWAKVFVSFALAIILMVWIVRMIKKTQEEKE